MLLSLIKLLIAKKLAQLATLASWMLLCERTVSKSMALNIAYVFYGPCSNISSVNKFQLLSIKNFGGRKSTFLFFPHW